MGLRNGETHGYEAIIIGGGQAGLAMGYELSRRGFRFVILDAGTEVGHVWKARWDSLVLFTPSQYDGLPGFPFPAEYDSYPTRDDVTAYLQAYALKFNLPVQLKTGAVAMGQVKEGYIVRAGEGLYVAPQVVLATGPFQVPSIPGAAQGTDAQVIQLHSHEYGNPRSLPPGRTLVVGGGNSGCQIAIELAASRPVELAIGQRTPVLPQRLLGHDLWWWNIKLGIHKVNVESRLGRRLKNRDLVIGAGPKTLSKRHGIGIRPRVRDVRGRTVTFTDGASSRPDVIIWATGYRTDFSWVQVPGVLDQFGQPEHRRGVSSSPGLYFIGLPWLWTRGSALLGFIKEDAAYLGERLEDFRRSGTPGAPITAVSRPAI